MAAVLLLAALAGCQTAPPVVRDTAVMEGAPEAAAVPASARPLEVLPGDSEVRLLLYRAGPLADFGHNHVVTGPVAGTLYHADDLAGSGFRLRIPVRELDVDPPAARVEEGEDFPGSLSDEARQATRENMLGRSQLRAGEYPEILVESIGLSGPGWSPDVRARVQIRDVARNLEFPAAVFEDDERVVVIANFSIRQSDFGIEPYSAFNGGLQVRDTIDVRVRVTARRAP